RDTLTGNFVIILVKTLLLGELDDLGEERYSPAIIAVANMHRQVTERVLEEKLNDIMRTLGDDQLWRAIRFLDKAEGSWRFLRDDMRTRLTEYVLALPAADVKLALVAALHIEPLKEV
ncbi:MAG: hypothetical protein ABJA50_10045, partial [Chloroflexota bacterium]